MGRFARFCWLALAFSASSVGSAPLRAQVATPGSRVRITPMGIGTQTEGSLVSSTADSVSLHPGLGGPLLALPMDSVLAIDRSVGTHSTLGHVVRDAGIGTAIGIGTVALVGGAVCHISTDDLCSLNVVLLAVPAAAIGFLTGALIGRGDRHEIWERVYERPKSTGLLIGPTRRGGIAVGISFAFGGASQTR